MIVGTHITKNPVTVTSDTNYPHAVSLMREKKIRRLPVVDGGKLVGIVVEKDLLSTQPSPATTLSIYEMNSLLANIKMKQIMTHPVITVEGDCPMEEAARIMVEKKIGCLPVMGKDKLIGIITETDIFRTLVEVLGGEEGGVRLTAKIPERVGELARVTALIAEAGGNIISITTSRVHENSHREVTIKEKGANPDTLKTLLDKSGLTVIDLRTSTRYQSRLFG